MEKQTKLFTAAALILIVLGVASTTFMGEETSETEVVASFYPFYDITQQIAGDSIDVEPLVPPGTEPHSFELSPSDRIQVEEAEVFVATGVSFEQWEEEVIETTDVTVVDSSEGIELLEAEHEHSHDHGHEDHHDESNDGHGHEDEDDHHDHHYGDYDTHYWVSPLNAIEIAENIRDSLVEEFPEEREVIESNTEDFIEDMEELDSDFSSGLDGCEKDTIVTAHAAFAYLGEEYGFSQVPIHGISALSEPTPGQIEEIIDTTREEELDYIFYEELVDPRVAENIAEEAGVETLVLNPVAGSVNGLEGYVPIMEQNLENLEIALGCQNDESS